MVFYGYVDNGEYFVKCKITADNATQAYEKLNRFSTVVEEQNSAFRGNIECLMLRDENNENICQSHIDDVSKCLADYDAKHCASLEDKLLHAMKESECAAGTTGNKNDKEIGL